MLQTFLLALAERFPLKPQMNIFFRQHQCLGTHLYCLVAAAWETEADIAINVQLVYWSCIRRTKFVHNKIWLNLQFLWKCNRKHSFNIVFGVLLLLRYYALIFQHPQPNLLRVYHLSWVEAVTDIFRPEVIAFLN